MKCIEDDTIQHGAGAAKHHAGISVINNKLPGTGPEYTMLVASSELQVIT